MRRRMRQASPALVPIVAVLVLSPVGAELLAAYSDSTGRLAGVVFAIVFFAGLYGCPALARSGSRAPSRTWLADPAVARRRPRRARGGRDRPVGLR